VTDNRKLDARWLTPDEAAEYLRVSRGTFINLVKAGTIPKPHALTTRILRYDREAIDRAIAGPAETSSGPRLGDVDWGDSRDERKRAWQERQSKKRSWTEREAREREERDRLRRERRAEK
jgi:excisionase family DNA binding protein